MAVQWSFLAWFDSSNRCVLTRVHIHGKCQSGLHNFGSLDTIPPCQYIPPEAQEENPWSIWVSVLESAPAAITMSTCHPAATKARKGASEAAGAGTAPAL